MQKHHTVLLKLHHGVLKRVQDGGPRSVRLIMLIETVFIQLRFYHDKGNVASWRGDTRSSCPGHDLTPRIKGDKIIQTLGAGDHS